jgi:hypothetical protein
LPQLPQCVGSVCSSTQAALHAEKPESQAKLQLPAWHSGLACSGAAQLAAQAPQSLVDLCKSTHCRLQLVSPLAQESAHAPCEQTCPAGQDVPHVPQLSGSLARFGQAPWHEAGALAQRKLHVPESQLAAALGGAKQRVPQPPQLSGSRSVSTQLAPQRSRPDWHENSQRPAVHSGRALGGALQLAAQPPQCSGSSLNSAQLAPQATPPSPQPVGVSGAPASLTCPGNTQIRRATSHS